MGATGNRGLMLQHAAMGMLSSSIEDHATSKATTSAIHHRHAALNPVNTTAAPVKTAAPPQRIVWVRKPIQRWRPTQNTMQEVGSVEFATLAPLASIRRLIDQFHPLPDKREYEFYHPSLRTRIDPSEELSVFPAEFPYILLAALPPPHRIKAQHQPAPQSEAISAAHKTADDQAVLVHPHRTNATAAPAKTMKKAPAHPGSMEARTATTPSSQPAAYRDVLLRNKLVSGVRCDFTVREFPERNLVGLKAQLREGSWSGRSTPIKWLSMEEVKHLTKQTAQEGKPCYSGVQANLLDCVDPPLALFSSSVCVFRCVNKVPPPDQRARASSAKQQPGRTLHCCSWPETRCTGSTTKSRSYFLCRSRGGH